MTRRLYVLEPWLIRALIPKRMVGSYLLYRKARPSYAGRSDRDLRRRLIVHAYKAHSEHFGFDVHADAAMAFDSECAHYHVLQGEIDNRVHPASPWGSRLDCFICQAAGEHSRPSQMKSGLRLAEARALLADTDLNDRVSQLKED